METTWSYPTEWLFFQKSPWDISCFFTIGWRWVMSVREIGDVRFFSSLPFRQLAYAEKDIFSCFFTKNFVPQSNLNRCLPGKNGKRWKSEECFSKWRYFASCPSLVSLCISNRGRQRTLRPENVSTLCCAFNSGHALSIRGRLLRTYASLGLHRFHLDHWKEPPHLDPLHPDSLLSFSNESKGSF